MTAAQLQELRLHSQAQARLWPARRRLLGGKIWSAQHQAYLRGDSGDWSAAISSELIAIMLDWRLWMEAALLRSGRDVYRRFDLPFLALDFVARECHCVFSQLVYFALCRRFFFHAQSLIARVEALPADLRRCQRALEYQIDSLQPRLLLHLRGEIAFTLIHRPCAADYAPVKPADRDGFEDPVLAHTRLSLPVKKAWARTMYTQQLLRLLALYDAAESSSTAAVPDRPENRVYGGPFAGVCSSTNLLNDLRQIRAALQLLALGLALRRHHYDHGAFPKVLTTLAPRYIRALPLDPLTGEHFSYRGHRNECKVYSVGLDGRDSRGRNTRLSTEIWKLPAKPDKPVHDDLAVHLNSGRPR